MLGVSNLSSQFCKIPNIDLIHTIFLKLSGEGLLTLQKQLISSN